MAVYDVAVGRIRVVVSEDGARLQNYGHGCTIACLEGWNDSCPTRTHTVSVEELRNLHYLLDRAIAAADACKDRR